MRGITLGKLRPDGAVDLEEKNDTQDPYIQGITRPT